MKKGLRRIITLTIGLIVLVCFIVWLINIESFPQWTGFSEYQINNELVPAKKLWDWMDLLIVPILIAITVWWLGWIDNRNQIKRDNEKAQRESLNEYFNTISHYLLDKGLRDSKKDSEVRSLARSRTIEFISRSDSKRKGAILQFLYESGLINSEPVINLNGSVFNDSDFSYLKLENVKLTGIYFKKCNFSNATFFNCNFAGSDFSKAKFNNCILKGTNFLSAIMKGVEMKNTDLSKAVIVGVDFEKADLRSSIMTNEQKKQLKNNEFYYPPKYK